MRRETHTSFTIIVGCKKEWCAANKQPWKKKCTWTGSCDGCSNCLGESLSLSAVASASQLWMISRYVAASSTASSTKPRLICHLHFHSHSSISACSFDDKDCYHRLNEYWVERRRFGQFVIILQCSDRQHTHLCYHYSMQAVVCCSYATLEEKVHMGGTL